MTPFISRRAFEAVTGPKKEWWPVETVGLLVTAVGAGLATAAARDRVTPEITIVAAGCAGGLAAIDIVYVARGASRPRTWPMPRPRLRCAPFMPTHRTPGPAGQGTALTRLRPSALGSAGA